jgi:hypothetical protein
MKSNLRYYVLAIMMVICIFRLTHKSQTLPTTATENVVVTTHNLSTKTANTIIEPINPINQITPEANLDNSFQTIPSNPNPTEEIPSYECVTPTEITLIEETSLESLKAQGWRFPQKSDYNPTDYAEIKKYYKNSIEADFDNNGIKDKAIFMVRTNLEVLEEKEQALFVLLKQKDSSYKIFYKSAGEGNLWGGLALQKAELIELGICKINLQSPAIENSFYGSCGGEIFYWDKEQGKFFSIYMGGC